ncbi:MAG: PD-(D/E)XK nuclease family protein, partial [Lachnospiraceae bacterium]|nr:PD-(D/E)XK nuclease family protein [Lachnospiraceae bacterium]
EKGEGDRVLLDDAGKSMIVKKLLIGLSDELDVYGANASKQGFVDEIKSVISELSQYRVEDRDLERMIELAKDKPLMKNKLKDIRKIYKAYGEFLSEHYLTGEEVLDMACIAAEDSKMLGGCTVCLDGFTGFSPSQFKLIEVLMRRAADVHVTLTMSEKEAGRSLKESNLFYLSYKTARKLSELAALARVDVKTHTLGGSPKRFADAPALAHLERNIFRSRTEVYAEDQDSIIFLDCRDKRDEVFSAVCELKRYIRSGVKGNEMAVVCSDVSEYGRLLEAELTRIGIPCFVDEKQDLIGTGLVEALRAAMEVSLEDFSYESVFRMLRSGAKVLGQDECDELENYVLALGIRGRKAWAREWTRTYKTHRSIELDRINEMREKVYAFASPLDKVLGDKKATVREKLEAVYTFASHVCESETGPFADLEEKRIFDQTAAGLSGVLDRLESLLGDEVMAPEEFAAILETGFREAKLRKLPPSNESVIIGDIERTRLGNIKILFFLGVSDAKIPKKAAAGGVLSDADREFLGEHDFELAPTARQQSYLSEFYLYLNMTKPSEKLYLSFCALGGDGKPVKPSYVVERVKKLFGKVETRTAAGDAGKDGLYDAVLSSDGGLMSLSFAVSEDGIADHDVLHTLYEENKKEHGEMLTRIFEAYSKDRSAECIDEKHARALYGDVVRGSITRLELYASCAFAHFARYGLELEERKLYEVGSRDIGTLYHGVLENFCRSLKRDGISWRKLEDDAKERYLAQSIEDTVSEYGNDILKSSAKNEYMTKMLERIMRRTVDTILKQIRAGSMEPAFFEEAFAQEGRYMKLTGKIDRMDVCERDGKLYLRIVDYKSGKRSFDLSKLYFGLSLQLGIYMKEGMKIALEAREAARRAREAKERGQEAAKKATEYVQAGGEGTQGAQESAQAGVEGKQAGPVEGVPAGMYYYLIGDPIVDEKKADKRDEELKMTGLSNSMPEAIGVQDGEMTYENGHLREKAVSAVINVSTDANSILDKKVVASTKDITALTAHLEEKMEQACEEILSGETGAVPYKYGGHTGCEYCDYSGICGFGDEGRREYREFKVSDTATVWELLGCRPEEEGQAVA